MYEFDGNGNFRDDDLIEEYHQGDCLAYEYNHLSGTLKQLGFHGDEEIEV